ncbi:MAG TPA: SMP-30/gluconolactonase/LRE family protein [Steroidobacteraceae bacterium]|nr:SMP-30/gluconolactonase/LRE family protein [Steroidobacteraceae bacterium]
MGNRARGVLAVAALAMVSGAAAAATPPAAAAGCNPDGELRYLCGPANAEDMVRLGETRWLVTSGMDGPLMGGGPARGHLYLVDHQAKTFVDWFPGQAGPAKHDKTLFGSCPGPVEPNSFSAHGLSLKEQSAGRYRLYVTAHGAREAVEVFDIDASGARPTVAWVGCVVLPDDVMANGVTMLPDGGFVVTKFLDRRQPEGQAFAAVQRRQLNGALYEWRPGGKVQVIPGTEMSGPNGILASADGRTLYVAAFGTSEVIKFQRDGAGVKKQVKKVDIAADNLRWTPDGKMLAAGNNSCGTPPCPPGWKVLEIDPATLAARIVASSERTTGMDGATVGIRVGNEVWVGTYKGDRIGFLPYKPR